MGNALSPRAIFIACMVLSWLLSAIVEVRAMRLRRTSRLPDLVTIALLIQGLAFLLFSQRGAISDWLSIYVANILFVGTISLVYLGVEHRRGAEGSVLLAAVLPAAIGLLFPIIGFADGVLYHRVVIATLTSCAGYAAIILVAIFALDRKSRTGPLLIVIGLTPILLAQVIRAISMSDQNTPNLFAAQIPQTLYAAVMLIGMIVTIGGYVLMLKPEEPPKKE